MSASWAPRDLHEEGGSGFRGRERACAPRALKCARARGLGLSNRGAPAHASARRTRSPASPARGSEFPSNELLLEPRLSLALSLCSPASR